MGAAEKTCFKCLCKLPLEAFYKHSRMADGRLNKCVNCTKLDVNRHRQENLEKVRAYDKLRGGMPHRVAARKEYGQTEAGKLSAKRAHAKQVSLNPNKTKARNALANALRDGKVERWPCQVCGDAKSQGHHPDYDNPLGVVWLCGQHHRAAHALVKT